MSFSFFYAAFGPRWQSKTPDNSQDKPAKPDAATPRYKDPNAPIADRVADLLPRMTLEEKVEQLASAAGSRRSM